MGSMATIELAKTAIAIACQHQRHESLWDYELLVPGGGNDGKAVSESDVGLFVVNGQICEIRQGRLIPALLSAPTPPRADILKFWGLQPTHLVRLTNTRTNIFR